MLDSRGVVKIILFPSLFPVNYIGSAVNPNTRFANCAVPRLA